MYKFHSPKGKGLLKIFIVSLWFIWAGLIIGISFVETPLKFQAPNITTVLGLGIGKLVFTALNRIELGIAVIMAILFLVVENKIQRMTLYTAAIVILLVQTFWLLPALNSRVDLILEGQKPKSSYHHIAFVIGECSKLILLVLGGIFYMKPIAPFFGAGNSK